jgi:hypothetical protein
VSFSLLIHNPQEYSHVEVEIILNSGMFRIVEFRMFSELLGFRTLSIVRYSKN